MRTSPSGPSSSAPVTDALLQRLEDVRAAEQRVDRALADLLGDIGVWAALNGVDAIAPTKEPAGDIYLVQNRTA
jgi:hypothetical protein